MDLNHRHSDYESLALPLSYAASGDRAAMATDSPPKRVMRRVAECDTVVIRALARNRTADPILTMDVLYRLSYEGVGIQRSGGHRAAGCT